MSFLGSGFDVVGEFEEIVGGKQVDGFGVGILGYLFMDDGYEVVGVMVLVLFCQFCDFCFDGFVGLGSYEVCCMLVNEGQQNKY